MKKRMLIFDEDRDFATTIAKRLEAMGVESFVATNQKDASARMAWDSFDMVFVDLDVETGRGLAFCEYVAWNQDTRNVPIVVLTVRSHPDEIRRCCEFHPDIIRKSTNCWMELQTLVQTRWPQLAPTAAHGPERTSKPIGLGIAASTVNSSFRV